MINVSQDYKTMMEGRVVISRISVEVLSGDTTYYLTEDDIIKGTLSINWRATDNKDFNLGSVYAASMSFSSIKKVDIPITENMTVMARVFYKVGNSEQEIRLGKFVCQKPTVFGRTISWELYDNMLAFDKEIDSRFHGVAYNLLVYGCTRCGITLANSQASIEAMPNSDIQFIVDPNHILTYRDMFSHISQLLGGYCIINRYNELEIRQFPTSANGNIPMHRRTSSSFSGYVTSFKGVRGSFLNDDEWSKVSYIDQQKTTGIVVDIGQNPLVYNVSRLVQIAILRDIYNVIKNIQYTPCDITMVGDPSFEAGDMVTTPDSQGYTKTILLTSVTFNWRAASKVVSEGSDPALAAVSTQEKKQSMKDSTASKNAQVVTATYVNAEEITVSGSNDNEVITSLQFMTNRGITAIFGATIPFWSSAEGYLEIFYDDAGFTTDVVKARIHTGQNLVTLVNHLHYPESMVVTLRLKANTYAINGGQTPTVIVDVDQIRSYLFAQGIEVVEGWDGIIVIDEEVAYVNTLIETMDIADGVTCSFHTNVESALTSLVNALTTQVNTETLSDIITIELSIGEEYLRCGYGHRAGARRMLSPLAR